MSRAGVSVRTRAMPTKKAKGSFYIMLGIVLTRTSVVKVRSLSFHSGYIRVFDATVGEDIDSYKATEPTGTMALMARARARATNPSGEGFRLGGDGFRLGPGLGLLTLNMNRF